VDGRSRTRDIQPEWLVAADRDGLESREWLASAISERFGLDERGEAGLVAELRGGLMAG
jgi:hypothetical protein